MSPGELGQPSELTMPLTMLSDGYITAVFDAVVEATEEAIVNALLGATTMTGRDGITAHALPGQEVAAVLAKYGRS
jgi:D-aminopeptidase